MTNGACAARWLPLRLQNGGLGSELELTPPTTGTYYIIVHSFSSSQVPCPSIAPPELRTVADRMPGR